MKNGHSIQNNTISTQLESTTLGTMDGKSLRDYMRQRFSSLTALETRVISVLLSQCNIDETTLIKVVADETHVSKAMLVKIAKKLGFGGFRSLRAALSEHNRRPLLIARQELDGQHAISTFAEKARDASLNALEKVFSLVSFEDLEQASQWLLAARQRDFYGSGGSAHVARDAAYKFLRIGIRASTFDDGSMMLMSASLLQKGDVAMAFSYSGQTSVILTAIRQARKNGARVIAITNSPHSSLVQEAHISLCATGEDSPLTGEHGAARLAQLGLLDALFMAVARGDPTATEANLSRTMSATRIQRNA